MGLSIDQWSGADATNELRKTIESFNESAGRQAKWMLGMTVAMLFLTVAMTAAVAVQIWMAGRLASWW